jgi:hypothetical protein
MPQPIGKRRKTSTFYSYITNLKETLKPFRIAHIAANIPMESLKADA